MAWNRLSDRNILTYISEPSQQTPVSNTTQNNFKIVEMVSSKTIRVQSLLVDMGYKDDIEGS